MDKYLNILREAGVAESVVLSFAIAILVVPICWKLWREAVSLRHSTKKEKLERVFEVLGSEGVNCHPLRVELAFRELFAIRMTFAEIEYFLNTASPLSSITDYKYGRRYLKFVQAESLLELSRSSCALRFYDIFSTLFFMVSALMLIASLLFTTAAVSADVAGDIMMTGISLVIVSLILAWFCLDQVRAVNAAIRMTDGSSTSKEKQKHPKWCCFKNICKHKSQ